MRCVGRSVRNRGLPESIAFTREVLSIPIGSTGVKGRVGLRWADENEREVSPSRFPDCKC